MGVMHVRACASLLASLWLSGQSPALAEQAWSWRAIDLHPDGAYLSEAHGVTAGAVGGYVEYPSGDARPDGPIRWVAPLWQGEMLLAGDWTFGWVYSGSADALGGYVSNSTSGAAAIWPDGAQSLVTMRAPQPYLGGRVFDTDGDMQVGEVRLNGYAQAAVWTGADESSVVILHPSGADWSQAFATDGVWQGGEANIYGAGGTIDAVLWKGSAGSLVVMHPSTARQSTIRSMEVGTQVGSALMGFDDHAILWHDTPESWRDMHPSFHANRSSYIFGTTGTMHVGRSDGHAGYWQGDDPDSFFDLHQFLAPGASGSNADDIGVFGGRIYIAGRATYTRPHAIVWIGIPLAGGDSGERLMPQSVSKRNP